MAKDALVHLPVRVKKSLLEELQAHCEEHGISLASATRIAIQQYLGGSKLQETGVRSTSEFVEAIGHMETAATAIAALGKLVKK